MGSPLIIVDGWIYYQPMQWVQVGYVLRGVVLGAIATLVTNAAATADGSPARHHGDFDSIPGRLLTTCRLRTSFGELGVVRMDGRSRETWHYRLAGGLVLPRH